MNNRRGIYVCTASRCGVRGIEFSAMLPGAVRAATGRALRCARCGAIVSLRRAEDVAAAEGQK